MENCQSDEKTKNKIKDEIVNTCIITDGDVPEESQSKEGTSKSEASSSPTLQETSLDRMMQLLSLVTEEKETMSISYEDVIMSLKQEKFKNVITMVGAGISTAAGIPDFRSPKTGLYHNLAEYKLPYPEAIFELDYFLDKPEPFFLLAKRLLPEVFKPTKAHFFIKLLNMKGLLLRHYTQNIDNLDRLAGVPDAKLVEAHGSFHTSHCLRCKKLYTFEWMKEKIMTSVLPKCDSCSSLVKPDIVFFGESLPKRFHGNIEKDFNKCDLLFVMGSSLTVEPFASLVMRVPSSCPRVLINEKSVGFNVGLSCAARAGGRDIFLKGSCDDGCQKIADSMGWSNDLAKLINDYDANIST